MKIVKVGLLVAVVGMFSCTETKEETVEVPEAIRASFEKNVNEFSEVEWEAEGENFEVEYVYKGKHKELLYSPEGEILAKKTEINLNRLPAEVLGFIEERYGEVEIDIAEYASTHQGNYFEVSLIVEGRELDLIFAENGAFIAEEEEFEKMRSGNK